MAKNILIVDDSALMRRVTSDIISLDDRFCVADTAKNGFEAMDLILKNPSKYDAVILDINMPRMSGLEVLEQLLKAKVKINVIISSTVAVEGAKETIRALELGAFDFVTKPESFVAARNSDFGSRLLERLVVATGLDTGCSDVCKKNEVKGDISDKTSEKVSPVQLSHNTVSKVDTVKGSKLVFIACSTGGPRALHQVVPYIPKNIDAPVIIVQHMPKGFTGSLAARLNEISQIEVYEAQDGMVLEKGKVYLAQGGMHLKVESASSDSMKCNVYTAPSRNGLRPCADITFESLVDSIYDDITCVVLTGMGSDATQGIIELKKHKSTYVISQDEETCTVYGMPRTIALAGASDEVVPLNKVAISIINHVGVQKKWM